MPPHCLPGLVAACHHLGEPSPLKARTGRNEPTTFSTNSDTGGRKPQFDFSFFSDRRTASRRGSLPMRDSDRKLATILFFPAAAPRPGQAGPGRGSNPDYSGGDAESERENKSGFRETGGKFARPIAGVLVGW